ncbi:28S ribosomal protein S28, mitochondrial [Trachymyrmex septentrionalis]|uniref:28S ribosomal protein S28, mitochondrial n=1 Tax=Trachymyrmex septentrionalis TaxID=34720 RepID=A0A195EWN7_9HYME|nr:PREDICTED: 28S ribosomal protein S28, mitochondrial [Trachymyrmex septentrionalis]KYN32312.1 28S ribosomal protein S28, mitochondrial [Trachymyrmex septentrionalis]
MNKIRCLERTLMHLRSLGVLRASSSSMRYFSTSKDSEEQSKDSLSSVEPNIKKESTIQVNENAEATQESQAKLSGFARSYEKFSHINDKQPETPQTFVSLIRNSKFVDLGDPEGKVVTGQIYHVVGDDLYIDFGWKFYCVCQRPVKNGQYYVRESKVRLRIKDLELSSKFLGAETDVTLLEADCTLIGLISSPLQIAEQKMAITRPTRT